MFKEIISKLEKGVISMYNAYQEKLNEPENWIERSDLRTFVKLDGYVKKIQWLYSRVRKFRQFLWIHAGNNWN